ncbi:MAG: hypothetical protein HY437_01275 [Candidatus Magasanikbacteria bacterium]|nr:hypothetical protein [Candidatus Magasanikbacteria bacterium]
MMNLKSFFKIYLRKLLHLGGSRKPFYDFFYYDGVPHKKRALLSYRVHGVWTQSRVAWSAIGDVHDILRTLSEMGYRTDVIDYDDTTFCPEPGRRESGRMASWRYDLYIGHTGNNFEHIHKQLSPETVTIFYPMYAHWKFQNEEEERRLAEIKERYGVTLTAERTIRVSDDYALSHADGVIVMSNERGMKTYPRDKNIFRIDNAGYGGEKCMDLSTKDFTAARNGFLFIAGSGNAHKRLDVILEAFAGMPDKELYLCTKLEDDFKSAFEKYLFHTPNIHYIGHIRIYTPEFYDLMRKCNYVVFGSCSEGSPGAVIDAMFQGLIPLVSLGSHIDVAPHGFGIEPFTVEEVQRTAREVSSHDAAWQKERSIAVQKYAQDVFSIERYRETLKKYIQAIEKGKSAS